MTRENAIAMIGKRWPAGDMTREQVEAVWDYRKEGLTLLDVKDIVALEIERQNHIRQTRIPNPGDTIHAEHQVKIVKLTKDKTNWASVHWHCQATTGRWVIKGAHHYVYLCDTTTDWNKYSKSYHRRFGPALTTTNRRLEKWVWKPGVGIVTIKTWPLKSNLITHMENLIVEDLIENHKADLPLWIGMDNDLDRVLAKAMSNRSKTVRKTPRPKANAL